jgi:hypothetical protein
MTTEVAAAVPWRTRAAALLEVAGELGARASATHEARRRTALLGLHCLAAFAIKQFELFGKGFAGNTLAVDADFPPEFVLEATARQVGFDIDVLLRTVGQRDETNSTKAMRSTLDLADRLAADALGLAVRHNLIEETAVLTYFQKTPTIRLLPYVPLALIGIDLTAIHDTARLLAIAHEAGHHVYRQMTTNYAVEPDEQKDDQVARRASAAAPAQFPAWLLAWAEEIFADVYSVLVAGPSAGLSVQAMLMAELPAVMLQDDADHPLPALRPEIAIAVLRKLAAAESKHADARLAQSADLLQRHWWAYLSERQVGNAFTPAGAGQPITLDAARTQLHAYVSALVEGDLASIARDVKAERWSKGVAGANGGLHGLYDQFSKACQQLGSDVHPPELVALGDDKVAVSPQMPGVKGGQRIVGQIGDPYLDGLRDSALAGKRTLSQGAWKAVFLAGDWVTEEGGSGITPVKR